MSRCSPHCTWSLECGVVGQSECRPRADQDHTYIGTAASQEVVSTHGSAPFMPHSGRLCLADTTARRKVLPSLTCTCTTCRTVASSQVSETDGIDLASPVPASREHGQAHVMNSRPASGTARHLNNQICAKVHVGAAPAMQAARVGQPPILASCPILARLQPDFRPGELPIRASCLFRPGHLRRVE